MSHLGRAALANSHWSRQPKLLESAKGHWSTHNPQCRMPWCDKALKIWGWGSTTNNIHSVEIHICSSCSKRKLLNNISATDEMTWGCHLRCQVPRAVIVGACPGRSTQGRSCLVIQDRDEYRPENVDPVTVVGVMAREDVPTRVVHRLHVCNTQNKRA